MEFIKTLFYKYQEFMWFVAQAGAEFGKPLRFLTEFGVLMLLLSDSGINTTLQTKILSYVGIMLFAFIVGLFLAKIGVVKFNNSLTNKHNLEIQEILKIVRKWEENQKN